jgi:hypothetical protein
MGASREDRAMTTKPTDASPRSTARKRAKSGKAAAAKKSAGKAAVATRPSGKAETRGRDPRAHGFLYRNGLTLAFAALMLFSLVGHALTGVAHDNLQREEHGLPAQTVVEYLRGGEFQSTLFENWESEFLQMGLFVLLTVWLRQRGASESRKLDEDEEEADPKVPLAEQPWPMRRGGAWKTLYEHSLSLSLFALFLLSAIAHFVASWRQHAEEQRMHGEPVTPLADYLGAPQFWFESFQNWQSEFLAVIALCLLSIWLREKDSPQSKPPTARHSDTGA